MGLSERACHLGCGSPHVGLAACTHRAARSRTCARSWVCEPADSGIHVRRPACRGDQRVVARCVGATPQWRVPGVDPCRAAKYLAMQVRGQPNSSGERVTPHGRFRPHHPSRARPARGNSRVLRQRPAHASVGDRQLVHPTSRRIEAGTPSPVALTGGFHAGAEGHESRARRRPYAPPRTTSSSLD